MVKYPDPQIQSNWNNVPFAVFGSKISSKTWDTEEKNSSYAWGFWRVDTLWFIDHSEQLGCQDWPALSSVCEDPEGFLACSTLQGYRGRGDAREILPLLLSFSYPFSHTGLGHWSFLLGGFLGMLRDILTRKCLTFLITQASSIALFPESLWMKNGLIYFFKRWVKLNQCPLIAPVVLAGLISQWV